LYAHFFFVCRRSPISTLFPYTTLFRSLIDGFIRYRSTLPIEELWLYDPSVERRRLVGGMAKRMFAAAGHPGSIHVTDDLDAAARSEEHTSELQSRENLVCRLLLEKKKE